MGDLVTASTLQLIVLGTFVVLDLKQLVVAVIRRDLDPVSHPPFFRAGYALGAFARLATTVVLSVGVLMRVTGSVLGFCVWIFARSLKPARHFATGFVEGVDPSGARGLPPGTLAAVSALYVVFTRGPAVTVLILVASGA